jgi:hypothetical protein
VVLRLFDAAFSTEPEGGEWENEGGMIMPMRFQTRDSWHMIQFSLADYYESRNGDNAAVMTEAACIPWNAVVRRRVERRERKDIVLTTIRFRGVPCELVADYSHIWGRKFENEENRILSHFEKILREWAAANDVERLNAALDRFATRNQTSLMWNVFMEAGAEYPATMGLLLEGVLSEPVFLTHSDYAYGGAILLGALHKAGGREQRERLELLVLNLPNNVRPLENESAESRRSWVEHAQNRLLNVLEESCIMLDDIRELRRRRAEIQPLPANRKPEPAQAFWHPSTDDEIFERRGLGPKDAKDKEMLRLRDALSPFQDRNAKQVDLKEAELHWPVIQQCESAVELHAKDKPEMAAELWGHLVGACQDIARSVSWPKTSERWDTVRRILLKAATDPVPAADDEDSTAEDDWPSWGWPAPRLDAACGLPLLAFRLGEADEAVAGALRRLCHDKSHPLRFNLAGRVAALYQPAPILMWELIDTFIASEKKFSVLDVLLGEMQGLPFSEFEKVKQRLHLIADHAMQNAAADNRIHETLASAYLFSFLRTGDPECEASVDRCIAECDTLRTSRALMAQLHACRAGGWLTAGDGLNGDKEADLVRGRTWNFFSKLLASAQEKLKAHREAASQLHDQGKPDEESMKPAREKIECAMGLVDAIAMQLFFASGAFQERSNRQEKPLTPAQLQRFWRESAPLFSALASEPHPHTAYQLVQALQHVLPCAPRDVFLLAAKSIRSSAAGGFHYDHLAVGEVVKLIQRALADHRDLFRSGTDQESECLSALLQVLDLFVEAGWAEARQLTHRLEEIYR